MAKGPSNALIARRRQQLIEEQQMPPVKTIAEWRRPPDCREYARRYQVWELLAWYHHEVVRPELGVRGFMRRLWNRIRGKGVKNMSPWEQLEVRQRFEAHAKAMDELKEKTETELERLEAELEAAKAAAADE